MFLQCSEANAFEMEAKVLVGICFLFVCIFFFLFFHFVLQQLDRRENEDTEAAGSVVSLQSSVNSVTLVIQLPSAP